MNIFTPLSSTFELSVPQLKSLLATAITPKLPEFTYNGAYFWYSPWEDHCRRVIQVYPLKGASAIFLWGLCFDFLPVFGESKSLRYQRTDKSVGLHLFCWPPDHWVSISGQGISCRFSRFGQSSREVETRLLHAFYEAQELFAPWFQNCCNLHNALMEAKRQRTDPNSQYNWPSPDYVTAFLFAANGDTQTGVKILDEFWLQHGQDFPDVLYNKLRTKLLACANREDIVYPTQYR